MTGCDQTIPVHLPRPCLRTNPRPGGGTEPFPCRTGPSQAGLDQLRFTGGPDHPLGDVWASREERAVRRVAVHFFRLSSLVGQRRRVVQHRDRPGVYNWTNLDNAINNARAKGVTDIMYVIAGTPAFYSASTCAVNLSAHQRCRRHAHRSRRIRPFRLCCRQPLQGTDHVVPTLERGKSADVLRGTPRSWRC